MSTSTATRGSVETKTSSQPAGSKKKVRYRRLAIFFMLALGLLIGAISILALAAGLSSLTGDIGGVDTGVSQTLGISGSFAAISLIIALMLARATSAPQPEKPNPLKIEWAAGKPPVLGADVNDVLMREFEYGRETAAQATEERRTVLNFYLLIFGGAGSAVVAFLSSIAAHSELVFGAVLLFWLVNLIGWLALFQMIALRRAWVGSVMAMSYIKEFYLVNATVAQLSPENLKTAFHFRADSIPPAEKRWNTNHYSAILVALLDTTAFWVGATLIAYGFTRTEPPVALIGNTVLACAVFLGHWWSYDIGLLASPKRPVGKKDDTK